MQELLRDPNPEVRAEVVRQLTDIGTGRSLDPLILATATAMCAWKCWPPTAWSTSTFPVFEERHRRHAAHRGQCAEGEVHRHPTTRRSIPTSRRGRR